MRISHFYGTDRNGDPHTFYVKAETIEEAEAMLDPKLENKDSQDLDVVAETYFAEDQRVIHFVQAQGVGHPNAIVEEKPS